MQETRKIYRLYEKKQCFSLRKLNTNHVYMCVKIITILVISMKGIAIYKLVNYLHQFKSKI